MKLKPDRYSLYARVFPALITALPLFILVYFCGEEPDVQGLMAFLTRLRFYGAVSLAVVFLYLLGQVCRITGKAFEARHFTHARGFPTTYLLLYGDPTMSRLFKDQYRARVKEALGIELMDAEGEAREPDEARKRLSDVTKMVILRVGSGHLVLEHNVWYGFFRNLIGGSVYAVALCGANILYGHYVSGQLLLVHLSAVLLVLYAMVLALNRAILVQNAEAYAKQLAAEFLSPKA